MGSQRVKETKRQRNEETKRRGDKETKRSLPQPLPKGKGFFAAQTLRTRWSFWGVKETKKQRDKETKRQRDEERKRQRDKETKRQRVKEAGTVCFCFIAVR